MEFSLHSLIFVLSFFNGLLFTVVAFFKVKKDTNQIYLGLLLLLLTIMLFDEFSRWTPDFFYTYPQFTFIFTFAWFLFIPLIYLMIRYQTDRKHLRWYDIIHLVPLLIHNLHTNHFAIQTEQRVMFLESHYEVPEGHIGKYIFSFQIGIYLIAMFRVLAKKYHYQRLALFRRLSNWLKSIVVLLILYFLAIWVFIISYEVFGVYLMTLDIWKTNLFLVFIYGWLFYALHKPDKLKVPIRSVRIWKDHYDFSGASDKLKGIIDEIRKRELYLNSDLGVPELAKELTISGRRLTDLVNDELNISIPQLINILRIEIMEDRIEKSALDRLSLEGLAKSVGFRSKSSFYSFFKSFTGNTPKSYFRQLYQKNKSCFR